MKNGTKELYEMKQKQISRFRKLKREARTFEGTIEYGLYKIRTILGDFYHDESQMRCGCPVPCKRQEISLSRPTTKKNNCSRQFVLFHVSCFLKIIF